MYKVATNIEIHYADKTATITGAVHPDGKEYTLPGLKKKLQDKAKSEGLYGLEFWHYNSGCGALDHPRDHKQPGVFCFEIYDPYGRL